MRLPEDLPVRVTPGNVQQIELLWTAFSKCYPSEEAAMTAASRSAAPLVPTITSPKKIAAVSSLLIRRFGKDGAAEILRKNPAVLVVSAAALEKLSDEDIASAADTQDFIATNRSVVLGGVLAFFVIIAAATATGAGEMGAMREYREAAQAEREAATAARESRNAARLQQYKLR